MVKTAGKSGLSNAFLGLLSGVPPVQLTLTLTGPVLPSLKSLCTVSVAVPAPTTQVLVPLVTSASEFDAGSETSEELPTPEVSVAMATRISPGARPQTLTDPVATTVLLKAPAPVMVAVPR